MNRLRMLSALALTGMMLASCGPTPDTTAPVVTLTATPEALVASGTINLTATASDEGGIRKVTFYRGTTVLCEDMQAPYACTDTVNAANNGTVTYRAVATDVAGNMAEATDSVTVAIADANEPNDSIAAATTLTIDGTAINGAIAAQPRDMDYFKFDAAAGDMLKLTVKSVSVNSGSTLDPYVEILMPDGKTILEKDDDSGVGLESEIRFNAPATGTYTVIVTSFDIHDDPEAADDKATNTYQIALTRR